MSAAKKAPEPKSEPEPAPPKVEERVQIPEDPWVDHCPKCGLLGCVAGHY